MNCSPVPARTNVDGKKRGRGERKGRNQMRRGENKVRIQRRSMRGRNRERAGKREIKEEEFKKRGARRRRGRQSRHVEMTDHD